MIHIAPIIQYTPTNVVVELVLEVNEGGVRVFVKSHVTENRPNDKRTDLRGLSMEFNMH